MSHMEILAPVGTVETFHAAIESGADAVYVGAPGFNARNLARDLSIEEIGAMIQHCHSIDKKLYIAANSLILEKELPQVIEKLALFEQLQPDALIVQDLGLVQLIRKHFPSLNIHGSTLMTVHNSDGVRFLAEQGLERVVVARELTLKEIETIATRCENVELEVFIHGAMCFSYSGLCLFSSYLGGKSSLRGRCVQPCRRAYSSGGGQGRKKGKKSESGRYLFSMNDLSGLEAVPRLKELNVSSLKIEGRLRSAHYVRSIVQAYRTVVDAEPSNQDAALAAAQELAEEAMSRKTSPGYFNSPQPAEAITPHHSGNMGTHLGRFSTVKKVSKEQTCRFVTKAALSLGDRLRLHFEPSGERTAFRVKSLFVLGQEQKKAASGDKVSITLPSDTQVTPGGYIEVYKIDGPASAGSPKGNGLQVAQVGQMLSSTQNKWMTAARRVQSLVCPGDSDAADLEPMKPPGKAYRPKGRPVSSKKMGLEWWLRTDSIQTVLGEQQFYPDRYLLSFEKQLVRQAGKIKSQLGKRSRLVTWALPPIVMENELSRVHKQIDILLRSGFRSFQLGHVSQARFFKNQKVYLFADYTLNVVNSQTVSFLGDIGVKSGLTFIEADRRTLHELLAGCRAANKSSWADKEKKPLALGCMVYGSPALYTSRLAPKHFLFDQIIESPKKEPYVIRKKEGFTQTSPTQPFSLLPYMDDLKKLGVQYVVVDISDCNSKRDLADLGERLKNNGRYSKLSTFNYLGNLE